MSKENNQNIITLTDREKCRLRTPVFMGSFDCRMINLNEVLMNARDEINTNFESGEIHIKLHEDLKTITIRDTGRGIPIKGVDENGTKKSDLIFKTLFSGCNFENINKEVNGNFVENCGQNGAGLTTTQFISTLFIGTQINNYKAYEVTYKNGGLEEYVREYNSEFEHGSIITFSLDPDVVTNIFYTYEEVYDTVKRISSTTKNKIKYVLEYNNETVEFCYSKYEDYCEETFDNSLCKIIHFENKTYENNGIRDGQKFIEKDRLEVLLSLSTNPIQETYLNGGYLPEQGTFYEGILNGLRKTFQKEVGNKIKLTNNDIAMSFNIFGVLATNNPVYTNQTKFASSNDLYKKLATNYIMDNLEIVKIEDPSIFKQMVKHLEVINNANKKTEESRKKISKALQEKSTICTTRPKKFVPCRSKNPKEISFGVLEGDSAEGTVKLARDSKTMCFLPLKGKPLNCFKSSLNDILNNDEIIATFQILGCGMSYFGKPIKGIDKFNIDNLQVNEYLIITDQDEDGYHLQSLCIGNMYVLAPELIKAGVVKVLTTPLYIIKTKDEEIWAYDEIERGNIVNKLKQNNIKFKEQRFKGLGGLSVEAMAKCLDKETRKCYTITMEDAEECIKYLELFLGEDVEPRKDFIMTHAHEYEVEKYYE